MWCIDIVSFLKRNEEKDKIDIVWFYDIKNFIYISRVYVCKNIRVWKD